MRALPLFHRIAGQPVIVLGSGAAAEGKRRLVERAGGCVLADLAEGVEAGARLAFVAHDDPAACEADAAPLRAAGLLVNVVDRPDMCDFTVPSVLDRDPVLVAVGTDGTSAGLAKQLRLRLEQLLPPNLGRLAQALYAARGRLRELWPDANDRRRALDEALRPGGKLDPLGEAARGGRVATWLADPSAAPASEPVELVIASDDPDDLTLRQARLLGTADVLLVEQGIAPAMLERARADAVRLPWPHEGATPAGLVLILRRG
jgi:uroporphyrin-III C-methyltransferase/precorrin-2 dehydrogenase/sirohydrochlorin ferrochelatase